MAKKQTELDFQYDYKTDPVLTCLVCAARPFSKSDILAFAKNYQVSMTTAKPFLSAYLSKQIIMHEPFTLGGETYCIDYSHWLEIVRGLTRKQLDACIAIIQKKYSFWYDDSHRLTEAVWCYLHELPFERFLDENLFISYGDVRIPYQIHLIHSFLFKEEMWPFLIKFPASVLQRILCYYVNFLDQLFFSEDHLRAIKVVFSDNPSFPKADREYARSLIITYSLFVKQGRLKDALQEAQANKLTDLADILSAITSLQAGKYDESAKLFIRLLNARKQRLFSLTIFNFYFGLSLLYATTASAKKKVATSYKYLVEGSMPDVPLAICLSVAFGKKNTILLSHIDYSYQLIMTRALICLLGKHFRWKDDHDYSQELDIIDRYDIRLLKLELAAVEERFQSQKEALMKATGLHMSLLPYVELPEWELKLSQLIQINAPKQTKKGVGPQKSTGRIIYEVDCDNWHVRPILQKSKDGITWTAGRSVSLESFAKKKTDFMQPEDLLVASAVTCYSNGWYNSDYSLEGVDALVALVGNPRVFKANTMLPLEVVEEKPQLTVTLSKNYYKISSDLQLDQLEGRFAIILENERKVKVIRVTEKMKSTLEMLMSIHIPAAARDRLTQLLEIISADFVVLSDLLKNSEKVAMKQTHSEIVVQLQPTGTDIHCYMAVKPFGKEPPLCKPGKGMEVITTTIQQEQVQTKRNLKKEKENYEAVLALMVNYEDSSTDENVWILQPADCLDLLDRLREMPKQCVVEWPEGERFRVNLPPLKSSSFRLSVRSISNWFEVSGEVTLSDKVRMKLADLLERVNQSKGNFVQLNDQEYVRISSDLRKQLELLNRIASRNRGKMRVSTFNAMPLEEMQQVGMQVETDADFQSLLNRMKESEQLDIKIPKQIQADLRPYQKEGYQWMSRLAHWGAGALLADDMGLGKTLQAITLLLSRAKQGAQLVVVPTSLILNWNDEIARFAPGLHVLLLNRPGENRQELIEQAKAFDVVITTYGLLINEEESLQAKQWQTIVLDEAHTIKNRDTKMSKAAMGLTGNFRLLLTGTPLQNHVSEIWNLMQFANPNLLGSFQDFSNRFILPIERDQDKDTQRVLRRIISPFILRRTKNDVLNELPEKTEITRKVDLSEEEWAFYDHIRQQALVNIEAGESNAMQALAEITKLRLAACNAQLVNQAMQIPSSKLESFLQLVDDLHSNHHRALVFSQFTSHLALVRKQLDQLGITYLYLDGSTSAKERARLVDEFQHGDMPLFLISLKAGGLGLNLTAADYVIHLDPWWNPAIEDQASDRAYRIGQQNPVTVYRIIAAGTIEEKILKLHQTKKSMADALLEGGDVSASMSRDEIIALLKDTYSF